MTWVRKRIGRLFHYLSTRHVYSASYKTFQQDVFELIEVGQPAGIKKIGAAQGSTTLVSLPGLQTDVAPQSSPPGKSVGDIKKDARARRTISKSSNC